MRHFYEVFILIALMLSPLQAEAEVTDRVVRIQADHSVGTGYCVQGGYVVTAKHVVGEWRKHFDARSMSHRRDFIKSKVITVVNQDGQKFPATVKGMTDNDDGTAILYAPGINCEQPFALSDGPPPNGSEITLQGLGPTDSYTLKNVDGKEVQVQELFKPIEENAILKHGDRYCVESNGQETPYNQNVTSAQRIIPGDSGGPVFWEGRFCGIILNSTKDAKTGKQEVGINSWADTSMVLRKWVIITPPPVINVTPQPQVPYRETPSTIDAREAAIIFSSKHCQPCQQLMRDLDNGVYSDYARRIHFYIVYVEDYPDFHDRYKPGSYPTLMFRGYMTPAGAPYSSSNAKQWIDWVYTQPARPMPDPPGQKQTQLVPVPSVPTPGTPTGPFAPDAPVDPPVGIPTPVPTETDPGALDKIQDAIDWSGIRLGVMVSNDASDITKSGILLGPAQAALDSVTGGKVAIEVFSETHEPDRYEYVRQALKVDGFKLHIFVLADKVANVGLAKGMILGKIEGMVDAYIPSESWDIGVNLIFKRASPDYYRAVVDAIGDPIPGLSEEERAKSFVEQLIAFFIGFVTVLKGGEAGKGMWDFAKLKKSFGRLRV